ncbi:MAG: NDP-sugar synthase [Acidobacteriota bacterium]|nr:MAG: NDP-sugar synthase [Acidobacteriota bacterium]
MKAMILAAGFGTRLWPLTIGRTKPAIPFLNRPLIAWTIDYLRRHGIEDLIINLHHEPESVREQIGDGSRFGVRIGYSIEEPEILGTSGALDRVRDLLDDETFVVINGKIITDLDLSEAIAMHRERKALATLVLMTNYKYERFSEVKITPEHDIREFAGFPKAPDNDNPSGRTRPFPLMFTGIHILEPGIFDYIPRGVFSDSVRDVYPRAMAAGETVKGHIAEGAWYELSTIERYLAIHLEFMRADGTDPLMDEGRQVDPTAEVRQSVLWKGVKIGAGASIVECVIGDGVVIPPGAHFEKAAIVRADLAAGTERPEKALPGEVIGENLVVKFG